VHTEEIQLKARQNTNKTIMEKYGVPHSLLIPSVMEKNKNKIPWNKGKTGVYDHNPEIRKKISEAASNRIVSEIHKEAVRKSINQYYADKGVSFVLLHGEYTEEINCLKQWCETNNLDYHKVYSYIGKGPIKMIQRYDSHTRRWFIGKEIIRK
jgi:hypothetical protein